jgi:hypothetical protein
MSWNYRVIKQVDAQGNESHGIHEVYYDDQGRPHSCTVKAVSPTEETAEALSHTLIYMMRAFTDPVLDMALFEPDPDVEKSTNQALGMLRKNEL